MSDGPSPYDVFEYALADYAANRICDQKFLLVVEGQGRLVYSWIQEIQSVSENRFRTLREYQERCLDAYNTLLDGLRLAYHAINERNREKLDQARRVLAQGQRTVELTMVA